MAALPNSLGRLLNEHEVAALLGVAVATIRRWRLIRQGPKYIKVGAMVRYKPEDLEAWLDSRPAGGSAYPPRAANTANRVSDATTQASGRGGTHNAIRA